MLLKSKKGQHVEEARNLQKSRAQGLFTWQPLVLITTLLALLSLAFIVHASLNLQVDPQGCVMSMMAPTYLKLSGFDTEHSRFASKYHLYLYREEGVDEYTHDNIGLRGVPVLFIPGNAGSYKQVRSLSSEASRYFHDNLRDDQQAREDGVRGLDFFTIDFNEDLAAFHGQTVIDQAEYVNEAIAYILSLYHDTKRLNRDSDLPDPSSVILIGHSMGGIVARTVLVNSKYQANSVNTIITMSTPHARPPVSFDVDIVTLYEQINNYWREAYTQKMSSNNPLSQTTIISIAGGGKDTTVPSDYATISSLVPDSHGFTVFTSTIPTVWTSMDHLAITWADQLRKVIVKSLYEVVDVRRSAQTKSRAARMKVFRKWFLTGLEDEAVKRLPLAEHDVLLILGDESRSTVSKKDSITIHRLGLQDMSSAKLLPVPSSANGSVKHFQLLTDQPVHPDGSFDHLDVLFCSAFPVANHASSTSNPIHIDLSNGDASATRLACKRATGDAVSLPTSNRLSQNAFDQTPPFTFLQYDVIDLQEYQFVAVVDKSTKVNDGWVHAEFNADSDSSVVVDISLPMLLFRGVSVELPSTRALMTNIKIPALQSSLLAYNLKMRQHGCHKDTELFTLLVRQYIDAPHESKYFVNFKEGDINLHGVAPFMPPALPGESINSGVSFQIWSDPTCKSSLEFRLKPDLPGSLGKLVIRYRTVFAAFPLLVVAMVLRKQFRLYDNAGIFISFSDSLDQSLRLPLPILLLSMTFFATAFTGNLAATKHAPTHQPNGTVSYNQNDLLLGSPDAFFWFLVPLCGVISVGVCVILNYVVLTLLQCSSVLLSAFTTRNAYVKMVDSEKEKTSVVTMTATPRRRIINTVVLLALVATVIPYPFAYVVACLVQFATATRALRDAKDLRTGSAMNFFNYTHSILILMLWVLPINLPILVVWVHNLAVHWLTPFSSHHNVLSIMPFILLVETLSTGSMVPPLQKFKWTTNFLFFALAVYSAVVSNTTIKNPELAPANSQEKPNIPQTLPAQTTVVLTSPSSPLPQTATTTPSSTDPAKTSFDLLSPAYLTVGLIFVIVLVALIWLLMGPNARRPWSCRSHRKSVEVPLRQRGPDDAYEVNPDMWSGGGRFVGESLRGRDRDDDPVLEISGAAMEIGYDARGTRAREDGTGSQHRCVSASPCSGEHYEIARYDRDLPPPYRQEERHMV
ncbi:GPI inositol deacylase [Lithohypha guttulata]|uniref:GPI inositol-deacylase n=1 Tax=Lithohypha guttulata TaxID=1690604 RepID=A0AAN7YHE7_9EURO|nr:GPI inositol deacylase [Lithohypha guttulata]